MFVLGPGDTTVLVKMAPYLEKGRLVLVAGGRQVTCYSYVENLAAGMVLAAAHPAGAGETFILTDDTRIAVRELMTRISEALGYPPKFGSVPVPMARAGGWVLEMLWRLFGRRNPPPAHRYRVGIAARDTHFSCGKAKRVLGYRPAIPLDEGLRRMASWYHGWRAAAGG
jgi:nucleoside-diphosphate-sugar epimerase